MKKPLLVKIVVAFLLIALVVLGFRATDQQNQIQLYETERNDVASLLVGQNAVIGYSCGVLSGQKVLELTANNPNLSREFAQGPTTTIQSSIVPQNKPFWADSCRYVDSTNSDVYVELYVSTFNNNEDAAKAFPDFLQIVNDAEELPSSGYGQKLIYDGGAYYLLKNNKVIQTAASNGLSQETESFSRKVFEDIVSGL